MSKAFLDGDGVVVLLVNEGAEHVTGASVAGTPLELDELEDKPVPAEAGLRWDPQAGEWVQP